MQIKNKIQSFWKEHKLIGVDSIVFQDGNMLLIRIDSAFEPAATKTFGKIYELRIKEEVKLSSLLEEDSDLWSEIQINGQIEIEHNNKLIFGEGEMGNEGFIVKIDSHDNILWSLYSSDSNPFIYSEIINNKIHIFSSHGFSIVIDENSPSRSYIDNHFK